MNAMTRSVSPWSSLRIDEEAFARFADERGCDLGSPHAADLRLAYACARASDEALRAFEQGFAGVIARAVAKVSPSEAFVADVGQIVRAKLFAGDAPKIAEYSGRSSLASWLAVVATRAARSVLRRRDNRSFDEIGDEVADRAVDTGGIEAAYLKASYKHEFEDALRVSLARLPTRSRTVLRLHFADRLTVDGIAAFYRVGRSTAGRWLADARDTLRDETSKELSRRLGLSRSQYVSLLGLVRSQLEVSLGALASKERPAGDGDD
jgi:RNA polymerase sigma-70 factor (ECF subfamily)